MTSSILEERTVLGPCAPSTQATASTMLDLPLPFGPTTTMTPGSNSRVVVSANDLNPLRVSAFRNTSRSRYWRRKRQRWTAVGAAAGAGRPPAVSGQRSDLALRTQEGRTAVDLRPDDRAAAAAAGLAFAVVHVVPALEVADLAEQVAILLIGQRRATVLDRILQRLDHGPVKTADLLGGQRLRRAVIAQAGREEDLVGVDVADTGDEPLVHEEGLQLRLPGVEQIREPGPAHDVAERVETKVGELGNDILERVGGGDEKLAERPRVHEAELTALGEGDHHVRVFVPGITGRRPQQLAAHAEMGDKDLAALELHQQVLAFAED